MPRKANQSARRERRKILWRDQGKRCCWCGTKITFTMTTFEHMLPRGMGGLNLPSNLAASCRPCNAERGAELSPPDGQILLAAFLKLVVALAHTRKRKEMAANLPDPSTNGTAHRKKTISPGPDGSYPGDEPIKLAVMTSKGLRNVLVINNHLTFVPRIQEPLPPAVAEEFDIVLVPLLVPKRRSHYAE